MSFLQKLFKGTTTTRKEDLVPKVENEEFNPFTELTILQQHTDIVRQILILNRRRCLSVADDNSAIVWDLLLGLKISVLDGHSRPITCAIVIGSSNTVITGSSDKQIKVWDFEEGVCLQTITEHVSSVKCMLLLQSGSFVSGGEKLHLWSQDGKLLDSCHRTKEEADICLMILTRNERIVTASNKELLVYHLIAKNSTEDTDDIVQELALVKKIQPTKEAIRCLVNISETAFAAGCLDGCILVISSETYHPLLHFTSPDKNKGDNSSFPYSIQDMICADGRYLIAAVGSGFVILDTKTKTILCKPEYSHLSKVLHLTLACDSTILVTSSEDGSIRLWGQIPGLETHRYKTTLERFFNKSKDAIEEDLKTSKLLPPVLLGECLGHSGAVNWVADGGHDVLVSCGTDGLVMLWKNAEIQRIKRNRFLQKEVLMGSGIV